MNCLLALTSLISHIWAIAHAGMQDIDMLELFCGKAELSKQCRPLSHSRNILIYGPYAKFLNHNA